MANHNQTIVAERRKRVADYLSHHVDSTLEIIKGIELDYPEVTRDQVRSDIRFIKKSANPWLVGLAKTGYIFDVMLGVKKLKDHEKELEQMKKETSDNKEKREIMRQIAELVITRLSLEGEGPVFLAITSRK